MLRERLLGHYRITVEAMEALDYGAAIEMYEAALISEMRQYAYQASAMGSGQAPHEHIPEVFPEMGRKRTVFTRGFMEASTLHSLERIMRQHDCTLAEAQRRAKWYNGPIAEA